MQRSEAANAFSAYLPQDRLRQLSGGEAVPEHGHGAVLFADVVGFTGLTTRLAELYGPRRGAEEVPVYLNRLYEALNGEVEAHSGAVVGFAGDAITCWFATDDGRRATTCGLAMQRAMAPFGHLTLAGAGKGEAIKLALKVAVTAGHVRRFVVGDPSVQLVDVIAGGPVAQIEALEGFVREGQVVVSARVAAALEGEAEFAGVIVADAVAKGPSPLPAPRDAQAQPVTPTTQATQATAATQAISPTPQPSELSPLSPPSHWLLPVVRRRLAAGLRDFLTELRPVAALFLSFGGIDVEGDEEAPTAFDAVVRAAQTVATDYGGNVLQVTSGDKGNYLYMAFGAPVSHEDDVQRCAAAALELREALSQLGSLTHVAIGVGHGTARTGAYGSETRRTYGALGEGTNMAARMMSRAPHGRIYASDEFAAALGNGFGLAELPPQPIKGRAEPVRAFELVGRAVAGSDGSGPTEVGSGPGVLVGRAEELAFLRENIAAAARGEGRIVQVVAEAGMGKSELLKHALMGGTPRLRVVRGACQAFGRTAPYRLWKSVYYQLLNVSEAGPVNERMPAVHDALRQLDDALESQAPLLAPVLDLPLEAGHEPGGEDAEARSTARRTLLLNLFRSVARRTAEDGGTLVLVLEDLHWLDPASEELLRALAPVAEALPVLVLTTTRPAETVAADAPGTLEMATTFELTPLEPAAAAEVVTARLANAGLAAVGPTLVTPIVDRSGGNPFYLQELVTDLIHRASIHKASAAGPALDALGDLPTSLHSLLLGRLDRLTDHQQASLKVASVVGREFRTDWVAACQPGARERDAEAAFEATGAVGLTDRLSVKPSVHEFNHAITHEVAYESQSHAGRTRLHTALARFVETKVATPDEPHLDLLAHHYWLGDDPDKARAYLRAAGTAAQSAYANQAALLYLDRLLELQDGPARLPTLLDIGEVESFVGHYAAAEKHLTEALELAQQANSRTEEAAARRRRGELYERQGDHEKARGELEVAAGLCEAVGDEAELTKVLLALGGNVLWHLGEFDAAEAQLEQAVALSRSAGDVRSAARALHGLANVHYDRGDPPAAERALTESLDLRRAAKDDYGVANALNNLAVMHAEAGAGSRAEELLTESLTIRQRLGDAAGVAVALNNLGYLAGERGDLEAAKRLSEESLVARRELGDKLGIAVSLNSLAALYARLSEAAAARGAYAESAKVAANIGNSREVAGALAGLSTVIPEEGAGWRAARAAQAVIERYGAAINAEVRELLKQGLERGTAGAAHMVVTDRVVPHLAVPELPLPELVEWALHEDATTPQ